jgi:hypothetical protein
LEFLNYPLSRCESSWGASNLSACYYDTRGEFTALACQCHSMCFYWNPGPIILCVSSLWTWNDVDVG